MAIRQVKNKYATKDGRSLILEEKLKIMKQNIKLILKI